jgi:hypothetical protein
MSKNVNYCSIVVNSKGVVCGDLDNTSKYSEDVQSISDFVPCTTTNSTTTNSTATNSSATNSSAANSNSVDRGSTAMGDGSYTKWLNGINNKN